MRVAGIARLFTSVIFKHFENYAMFSMQSLVIGIVLIWNIDPNSVSNFKPFH